MHLRILNGFLGSGKTTLLLRMAAKARELGKKVAILVNEVGEIGVDNRVMAEMGYDVRELLGGCICCSMAGNLSAVLETLQQEFLPDLVLLEPTGAADPMNLVKALGCYKGVPFSSTQTLSIIDPLRLDMLMTVASPLIISSITLADIVLLNKADVTSPEKMAAARQAVIGYMETGTGLMEFSALKQEGTGLISELLPWKI